MPLHRQLGRDAGPLEVRDQPAKSRIHLLAAVCERDCDPLGRVAPREMEDQLERGVVAPMHVLEREQDRLRAREERDGLGQCVEQPPLVGFGIDGWAGARVGKEGTELGKDPDHVGGRRRQDVGDERRGRRAGEQTHQVEQRRVRNRPLGFEANAVQDEEVRGARLVHHRAEEARLADPRFADDQGDTAASLAHIGQHAAHSGDLPVATDDRGTDDVMLEMHGDSRCSGARAESMAGAVAPDGSTCVMRVG